MRNKVLEDETLDRSTYFWNEEDELGYILDKGCSKHQPNSQKRHLSVLADMSCSLNVVSHIQDIQYVEDFLEELHREDQSIVDKGFDEDSWKADWSDNDSSNEDNLQPTVRVTKAKKCWLSECLISLSPSEELLVAAKTSNLLILSKRWSRNEDDHPVYERSWYGSLSTEEVNDCITCILCVPLSSQKRSSEGNPDWTCIIVGFSSGFLRFYTNNGEQVLSQYLHDGPIKSIKFKTKSMVYAVSHATAQIDELIILYPKAIVAIEGFSLSQSLRACRNQIAKAQASHLSGPLEPPPLPYRKWKIDEHLKTNSVASCSMFEPCLFDRMQTASLLEGPQVSIKGATPVFHRFITTGKDPFLSVYHASEGGSPPIVSEVVMAVASKLTSKVFSKLSSASGWLIGSGKVQQQQQQQLHLDNVPKKKVEPGEGLPSRFVFKDKHRETENIMPAPIGNLVVITDGFNRVLLFDSFRGVFIRIWKGYRDAECGWIVVEEENKEEVRSIDEKKRALFLVIYAPKRGILEIYLMEQGSRVGAFNVGKNCRLLYQSHGSLGPTTSTAPSPNETNQCSLLYMDGTIKAIHVPFHCALSSTRSTQARDLHLLKKINILIERSLKQGKREEIGELLVAVLMEIQVPSSRRKGIDSILHASNIDSSLLKNILKILIENLQQGLNEETEDEDIEYHQETVALMRYCVTYNGLVDTYSAIEELELHHEGADSESMEESKSQQLANLLHITLTEASSLLKSVGNYINICLNDSKGGRTKNTNKMIKERNVNLFLSCFDVFESDRIEIHGEQSGSKRRCNCRVKDNLGQDLVHKLGTIFFEAALKGIVPISKLMLILESSKLPPKQLMLILTEYTQGVMSNFLLDVSKIHHLHSIVATLCTIKGGNEEELLDNPVGKVSQWWQGVRNILSSSVLIAQSLVMAVVCRSVAMEMMAAAQKIKAKDESDITSHGWEAVTMDMEHWNLLITQLEHLLDLDIFLHTTHQIQQMTGVDHPTFEPHMHTLEKIKDEREIGKSNQTATTKSVNRMPVFSVKGVLEAGCGAFAQILADCLVRQGLPGYCLGILKRKSNRKIVGEDEGMDLDQDNPEEEENDQQQPILDGLCKLREHFPFSLEQDILWGNCAWECLMVWNEDVEEVGMLSSSLVHISCIHNPLLQRGLGLMMWKTVFNESIKTLLNLVDKVGKAPKDRLCKKNIGLSRNALVEFLLNAKQLLEILQQVDVDADDVIFEIKTESLWVREKSVQLSIVEQAIEQPSCSEELLIHHWCLIVVLYLIMYGTLKSIKPSQLFDTKGRHAFNQTLYGTALLSSELDDKIMKAREEFCESAGRAIILEHKKNQIDGRNTSQLLYYLNLVLNLAETFRVDEDRIRRRISLELFKNGLDNIAQEIFVYIEDKDTFLSQMLAILRHRLTTCLFPAGTVTDNVSKLPTKISSWLQSEVEKLDGDQEKTNLIALPETYQLIQQLHASASMESKEYRFLSELIEALKIFL